MSLKSFLKKLAPEYKMLSGALTQIVGGVAFDPSVRNELNAIAERFDKAADSITASVKTIAEPGKPSAADVKKAVEAVLMQEKLVTEAEVKEMITEAIDAYKASLAGDQE